MSLINILYIIFIFNIVLLSIYFVLARKDPDTKEHIWFVLAPYLAIFYVIIGLCDFIWNDCGLKSYIYMIGYLLGFHSYNTQPYELWERIKNSPRKEKRKGFINSLTYRKVLWNAYKSIHNK